MSRALIILHRQTDRDRASAWVRSAPWGTRITFQEAKRSTDQNARMWAMLTDVARQVQWDGQRLSADDWKLIFLQGLKQELRMVRNLDGNGFVQLGRSSSDLSVAEMADLIDLIAAFGARQGVVFGDQMETAA
ncbi:MAG: recombination protein NinB [Phenylobacterium sp.]|uniref:recombination protein NinB n=1 Tax=Phenylobacterium sp. TaxID=1871053 RepID=UPI0025F1CC29|nr:recombination protein NinB [Phenylobacterium sp.]MCA6264122.1 recombination protein NinB [Phenylobacterium sp.]MCA6270598.1 recombination protein NinB [Phenylobacterium sp.]MCA6303801.1 recombination protein NinB [Phenylobacterium sp.]MCA6307606.1 recombination protein NinB [Phenylobacterium sp.]MCA6318748.1 recombination protein NinB [Phenylobacterium sp.]